MSNGAKNIENTMNHSNVGCVSDSVTQHSPAFVGLRRS